MKTIAITSACARHFEFIKSLRESVNLDLIIVETTKGVEFQPTNIAAGSAVIWTDSANKRWVANCIDSAKADHIFVFGSGLLRSQIVQSCDSIINIHTGLTQYHRGVDSAKWAVYEDSIDLIGATVHYLTNGIDDGKVLGQRKIEFDFDDTMDSIFIKTCRTGFELLSDLMPSILDETVRLVQLHKGRLFQNKDMTLEIEAEIERKIDGGIIKRHLLDLAAGAHSG